MSTVRKHRKNYLAPVALLKAVVNFLGHFKKFSMLCLLIAVGAGFYYWFFYFNSYSRDAFVYANVVEVSSIVSGNVENIYVHDNQKVTAGTPLFQIDPRPYQYQLLQAKANLEKGQIDYREAQNEINKAEYALSQKQVELQKSQEYLRRYKILVQGGAIPQINVVDLQAQVSVEQADVKLYEQQLVIARQKLNTTMIQALAAKVQEAQYNLNHTLVKAKVDGYVTNLFLHQGSYVSVGKPSFALIDDSHWWVIAQYRETVLRHIHVGDKVNVHVALYPGKVFHGVVESIGWGVNRREASSDAASSSLTYIKPTEDWIQMAQRFSVRIKLTNLDSHYPLRVGADAYTSIAGISS